MIAFLRAAKLNPALYKDLVRAFYRARKPWAEVVAVLPEELRESFGQGFFPRSLEVVKAPTSDDGTTTKALLRTVDGLVVESVLIRHETGRTTLCVSSQVGCTMGCVFCATARLGLTRNLRAFEILEQVDWAIETLKGSGRDLRNIVFMGMGEPLLNPGELHKALAVLQTQSKYEIAPSRIAVSTCGVVPGIGPLGTRFPLVKLAISLHAADDALRLRLMPAVKPWPLAKLMAAADAHAAHTDQKIFYEYIMIAGINDSPELAAALAKLLGPRAAHAHVNLIPYNPDAGSGTLSEEAHWRPSDRTTLDHFQGTLKAAGVASTVRVTMGDSIAAACGQLAGEGKRKKVDGHRL